MLSIDDMINKYGNDFFVQLEIEAAHKEMASAAMAAKFTEYKTKGKASKLSLGQKLIDKEFGGVYGNIKNFIEHTLTPKPGVKPHYAGIIDQLAEIYSEEREKLYNILTFITFSTVLNNILSREHRLSNLAQQVAFDLQVEARLEKFFQDCPDVAPSVTRGISIRVSDHCKTYYAHRRMAHNDFHWTPWNSLDSMHLGCKLIELLLAGCGYFEEQVFINKNGYSTTEIRPTQWFLDTWLKNENHLITSASKVCPSVIPPSPWENFRDGGYYGSLKDGKVTLLRLFMFNELVSEKNSTSFSKQYLNRLNQLELKDVREAVNAIQETPWTINKKILDLVYIIIGGGA